MQGLGKGIYILSVQRPQPHNTNQPKGRKRRKGKIVEDEKNWAA